MRAFFNNNLKCFKIIIALRIERTAFWAHSLPLAQPLQRGRAPNEERRGAKVGPLPSEVLSECQAGTGEICALRLPAAAAAADRPYCRHNGHCQTEPASCYWSYWTASYCTQWRLMYSRKALNWSLMSFGLLNIREWFLVPESEQDSDPSELFSMLRFRV